VANTIPDTDGRPSQPFRSIDVAAALLRKGIITRDQANAADRFKETFRWAGLDKLKAADLSRIPGGTYREDVGGPEQARKRIAAVVKGLGGITRAPGSCVWHVLGLEWTLKRWAMEELGLSQEVARGVLIATLCVLAEIYADHSVIGGRQPAG
jgi:hypothetical protein